MMSVRKKYLVVPGKVRSQTDGDRHWVGFGELVQLYGVDPKECIAHNPERSGDDYDPDLIVLHPREDGDYRLPVKRSAR